MDRGAHLGRAVAERAREGKIDEALVYLRRALASTELFPVSLKEIDLGVS